jgi:PIN domain nuclease of toxin-antitoxin system
VKVLLDTRFFLWWLDDAALLGERGRALIADPENLIFVSAATLWELRIKEGLGRLELPQKLC